jgi:hypothetical protein
MVYAMTWGMAIHEPLARVLVGLIVTLFSLLIYAQFADFTPIFTYSNQRAHTFNLPLSRYFAHSVPESLYFNTSRT